MTLAVVALLLMLLCAAAFARVAPGRVETCPHGRALTRFAHLPLHRLFWPRVLTRPG